MTKTWLALDVSYLCWRARYTGMSRLSFEDIPTGVVYGFLRDLLSFQEQFKTPLVAFCFDSKKSLRRELFSGYKSARREKYATANEEELNELGLMAEQIANLRKDYLPSLGFKNVFWQKGYEADDQIAGVCQALTGTDEAVIIGSDKDLYQLLGPRVKLYKPREKVLYTEKDLAKDYFGLAPSQWAMVKALAGCGSDSVPGVKGVGDKTAAKFLKTLLNERSKIHQKILAETETWKRNLPLVSLPFPNLTPIVFSPDEVTPQKWRALSRRLGMKSLFDRF